MYDIGACKSKSWIEDTSTTLATMNCSKERRFQASRSLLGIQSVMRLEACSWGSCNNSNNYLELEIWCWLWAVRAKCTIGEEWAKILFILAFVTYFRNCKDGILSWVLILESRQRKSLKNWKELINVYTCITENLKLMNMRNLILEWRVTFQ